ncbi:MAG: GMC family oxidoreductase [Acidobacteriia bacterium]|nr:GMC family oxidoreductase [Terriglobia bacterium]
MLNIMYLDPQTVRDGFIDSADVCLIGSGAGGSVLAKNLVEAGLSVIVLEEGGNFSSKDFNQREADMMPMLYQEAGGRATKDLSITVLHAKCVGGTTVVNNCICFRTPEDVLGHWHREFGVNQIDARSLEPHFERVEKAMSVSPIQDYEINDNNRKLLRGAEKLGWRHGVIHHNRVNCSQCGCCMLGCPFDAKRNSMTVWIPQASALGARIYPQFRVERIRAAGMGRGRVSSVTGTVVENPRLPQSMSPSVYLEGSDARGVEPPRRFTIHAKLFILAGGAVNSPQLLLNSRVANSNGQVGKNLALHPLFAAFGLFEEELKSYRGIPQSIYVDQFRDEGFVLEGIFAHPTVAAASMASFGVNHQSLMRQYSHYAAAYTQVKDGSNGQVTVDRWGHVVLDYKISDNDLQAGLKGLGRIAEAFFAAGAKSVMTTHNPSLILQNADEVKKILNTPTRGNDLALFSAHPQGSCRMAADPARGVVDSFCRSHDLQNLFICDASVFPTSIGVNPMITIMALADRCAAYIIENKQKLLNAP